MDKADVIQARDYRVVKANEIIQRARYDLTLKEIKTFSYLVSKIKPDDKEGTIYSFKLNDYCDVLGIDRNNGKNIQDIKASLKKLRDKSFILELEDKTETTVGWLDKVWYKKDSIEVRFDEDIQKYLIGLTERGFYTQYELLCTLPMSSTYSVKIYEYLKSYIGNNKKKTIIENTEELMIRFGCEKYRYPDFRRKVIEKAINEINTYTDIEVIWIPLYDGKRVDKIRFNIIAKKSISRLNAQINAQSKLA